MSKAQVRILIDKLFVFIEQQEGSHPLLLLATKYLNGVVDGPGLDAFVDFLKSHGIDVVTD